jgi:hypothetical protein
MRAKFAIAAIFLIVALPASAQQTQCNREGGHTSSPQVLAAKHQMHSACAADIASLCTSRPACTSVARCLRGYGSRLTPACSGALAQLQAARREGGQN